MIEDVSKVLIKVTLLPREDVWMSTDGHDVVGSVGASQTSTHTHIQTYRHMHML